MQLKNTLVIGASTNAERYSNIAIHKLLANHHKVFAIGQKKGMVANVEIETELIQFPNIDTITLYVNPTNQKQYYDYLLQLHPKRIIFNPGTENAELMKLATAQNIECIEACTLVLLSTKQY